MDPDERFVPRSTRGERGSGGLKWGLGGLGMVGAGLAACSLACTMVIPLLPALGFGAAAASAVELGTDVAGTVLFVGGSLVVVLAGARWWRRRRSRGPVDASGNLGACTVSAPRAGSEPVACTLDGSGVRQRLDEFRAVFRRGYVGGEHTSGGVRWRFRNVPGLGADLLSLAEREHACCRFLRFDLRVMGDEVWWETEVDDLNARPILDEFFALPARLSDGVCDDAAPEFWPGR
jgi:hypothetical protein